MFVRGDAEANKVSILNNRCQSIDSFCLNTDICRPAFDPVSVVPWRPQLSAWALGTPCKGISFPSPFMAISGR